MNKPLTRFTGWLLVLFSTTTPDRSVGQDLAMNPSNNTPMDAPAFVRQDLVQEDLSTLAVRKTKEPFTRTVVLRNDELFGVRVVDTKGQLRMEGSYADSTLLIPHGTFRYYHPNGRLESEGEYVNGRKTGIWQCATASGERRPDRHYHGLAWDDLQIAVGLATRATRHAF